MGDCRCYINAQWETIREPAFMPGSQQLFMSTRAGPVAAIALSQSPPKAVSSLVKQMNRNGDDNDGDNDDTNMGNDRKDVDIDNDADVETAAMINCWTPHMIYAASW